MAKADLTAQRLRELLHYDPNTGEFTRLAPVRGGRLAGSKAGTINFQGYIQIGIDGRLYTGHRLAFLHVTGEWPKHHVDHIDGDGQNNSFCNLRDVPRHVNMQNMRRAHKDSSSGLLGVSRDKHGKKWIAQIYCNGTRTVIGTFQSKQAAHAAYVSAKRGMHIGGNL